MGLQGTAYIRDQDQERRWMNNSKEDLELKNLNLTVVEGRRLTQDRVKRNGLVSIVLYRNACRK